MALPPPTTVLTTFHHVIVKIQVKSSLTHFEVGVGIFAPKCHPHRAMPGECYACYNFKES